MSHVLLIDLSQDFYLFGLIGFRDVEFQIKSHQFYLQ